LLLQTTIRADAFALASDGNKSEASTAITAITVSNSISVNPERQQLFSGEARKVKNLIKKSLKNHYHDRAVIPTVKPNGAKQGPASSDIQHRQV
jgi:hypothetical protein